MIGEGLYLLDGVDMYSTYGAAILKVAITRYLPILQLKNHYRMIGSSMTD